MIQVGKPSRIGVTFKSPGLSVAFRVGNSSGPLTAWLPMTNFDGKSYGADYTHPAVGSFWIKKVVFTDGTFTTRDTNYSEADDAVQVVDNTAIINVLRNAAMGGQVPKALINGEIVFTQGDTPTLLLTATTDDGTPFDLTGAVLTTEFLGPTGSIVSIPNSQHTIAPDQVNNKGQYSVALTAINSAAVEIGSGKEIVTEAVQGAIVTFFHGYNVTVLPNVPEQ